MSEKSKVVMFERIMVIDDQDADQMLARYAILAYNENADIIAGYDGVEALETLADLPTPPDIIFLDINMPRMNGFQFLEKYSQLDGTAPVVVMLTSSDQELDRTRCAEFDAVTGFEVKPISVEVLKRLEQR